MKKKIDQDAEFFKLSKEAAGIFFWESEYLKRKFLSENEKEIPSIKYGVGVINDYFSSLLSEFGVKNDLLYPMTPIKIMQREFYRREAHARIYYGDIGKKVYNFFSSLESKYFPDEVLRILHRMAVLSFNYHYYVDDLVAPHDFDELAPSILDENGQLPTAPPLYHHKDAFPEICEDVYRIGFAEHADEKLNFFTPKGEFECDYLVLINFQHKNFNYSEVVNTFRKQLAYLIHRAKSISKMTDEEKKELLFTYKLDAGKGYGSEFAVSRAVGLWMWDSMFKNKDKSKIDIFREIELTKYKNNFDVKNIQASSGVYIRLKRILSGTEKCVKSGKVLRVSSG